MKHLIESARLNPPEPPVTATAAEQRCLRLACLERLDWMHAYCAPEDPNLEYLAWEEPLARFESDELLCLLDMTAAEAEEALEAQRPFHFSGHLSALVLEWTHRELTGLEEEGYMPSARATHIAAIFDASYRLFVALLQEADIVAAPSGLPSHDI